MSTGKTAEPNLARYLAARSFVADLEKMWKATRGELPKEDWPAVEKDPALLERYRTTLQAWAAWSRDNSRYAAGFFAQEQ